MKPLFEYDPDKNNRNKEKHGVGLVEAQKLWGITHLIIPAKDVGKEIRYAILGKIEGRLHVAIFTRRASIIRIISYHRADRRMERIYERYIYEKKES